jgi:indole-3-glycerol phosphate synthase
MGADAMLLIADILEQETLAGFIARARLPGTRLSRRGPFPTGPGTRPGVGAEIVGINNRDLDTFQGISKRAWR